MATSLLAFHLPAYFAGNFLKRKFDQYRSTSDEISSVQYTAVNSSSDIEGEANDINGAFLNDFWPTFIPRDHREVIKIALVICPLWFGANCFYNYSLLLTSVSSSTIIRSVPILLLYVVLTFSMTR